MKISVSADITIRLLLPSDDSQLFSLLEANRSDLKQWLPWLDLVTNLSQTQTFIETAIYQHCHSEASNFAIFYQHELVGLAGFNTFDFQNKFASLGYWLAKNHRGRGIISQVVVKLLDYGFSDLALHKIEIKCAQGNTKSEAIAKRLGFVYEGRFRQCEWLYDHYVDHLVYSILFEEYCTRRTSLQQMV
ncbi:GNAT family protein [Paraglaciecola aquimarina]|uniref:GNAT family protein n=1 Tax=Paraglaciecola aquimarina TaxID=1235557 RepID=A0ABU3SZ26_9ALTE|nr:GNAT family protein [Paraglaciecola aquimarina]MDU0355250.1 GNAT family protein [Paraglaciecola aquimarina]